MFSEENGFATALVAYQNGKLSSAHVQFVAKMMSGYLTKQ